MNNQLLFLLSAIGGLNGIVLSVYFALCIREKSESTYFLSGLILAVSIRITKSAFLYFNGYSNIGWFIQFGLIACALIGPFLYLYVKTSASNSKSERLKSGWLWHIVPVVLIMISLFNKYPYAENRAIWGKLIGWGIYSQWLIYVLFSVFLMKKGIKNIFNTEKKITNKDIELHT